jgi:plastocyanin
VKKLLIFFLPLALFGCQAPQVVSIRDKQDPSQTVVAQNNVKIENGVFAPSQIKIKRGSFVNFSNVDNAVYTLFSNPHPSHSFFIDLYKVLHKDETYNYQFNKSGNFGVHTEENTSINLEIVVE